MVDLIIALEEEFYIDVPDEHLEKFVSVPAVVNYIHAVPYRL